MIEAIRYHFECNAIVNQAMIEVLAKAGQAFRDRPLEGHFKSPAAILDHVLLSDMVWMKSFGAIKPYAFLDDPVLATIPAWGSRLTADHEAFAALRGKLDGLYLSFASELEEEDLHKILSRTRVSGERMEKVFWKALLHILNHQTHHRGQVSQCLEEAGFPHDYSNMIFI
jgi:uncharacterized damage-inducible protein DinB